MAMGTQCSRLALGVLLALGAAGCRCCPEQPDFEPFEVIRGHVRGYENDQRRADKRVPGALLWFESEDGAICRCVEAGINGAYKIHLPAGRYWITIQADGFELYQSFPGVVVITEKNKGPYNPALTPVRPDISDKPLPPGTVPKSMP